MLNYRLDNLVVLLFGRSEVRPRQVLQLRDDPTVDHLAIGVFLRQLEPALNQIRHEALDGDEEHFLIAVERDALNAFILPHLRRPVLVTLDLSVLLEVRQHDDERDSLLVNHSPEVFYCCLEWPLRSDEQLVVATDRSVNEVGVDVRITYVLITLDQTDARVFD